MPSSSEVSPGSPDLRISYTKGTLSEADLAPDPLAQFRAWFGDAVAAGLQEPNAMVVATATAEAQPSTRTMLLKDVDERGFVFYTNLTSRKSGELAANPGASCLFPWLALHRQVVVVGRAELVDRAEVSEYFRSRPHESQLGAWTSRQSSVIEGRVEIERRFADLVAQYPDDVHRRLLVKPGMTGLWQVSGRSDLDWEESVRLDLYYVDNWSLVLDLHTLWRTIGVVVFRKGAY